MDPIGRWRRSIFDASGNANLDRVAFGAAIREKRCMGSSQDTYEPEGGADPAALIGEIAAGSQAAFDALYTSLQPKMVRYAAGLLAADHETAADAVDEAFFDVWRSASSFQGQGSAEGWVRRIVRNKAIDLIRKNRERLAASEKEAQAFEELPDETDTPERLAEKLSDIDELWRRLQRLSHEHREAVWLCYYEEKSLAEIAEIVGCPENTVKTRLFHARKLLREHTP
jgi:RNA polymerase sigma-70 factor (ECF subfamily)